ncbi:hypothetical protein AMELA_G00225570 [Ameiurus melas]|uniref:Uncharacterized protein n=1 Tax=Ameiurus melas TaxID=219545 RepID=A0A7J6A1F9_AMEME|nr:hypothetical protein AMELA_G00225570 [Ameiurus melas]
MAKGLKPGFWCLRAESGLPVCVFWPTSTCEILTTQTGAEGLHSGGKQRLCKNETSRRLILASEEHA